MTDVGAKADEASDQTPRVRLLEAAYQIAAREGEQAVTYRSVASRAGVAHGLVRHYFGSREALIGEVMGLAAAEDSREVGLDAALISDFVSGFVEVLDATPERQLLQFDFVISAIRGKVASERAVAIYDRYLTQVGRTLKRAGIEDPDDSWSEIIFTVLDGLTLQHQLYGDPERTERILRRLREVMEDLAHRSPEPTSREEVPLSGPQ